MISAGIGLNIALMNELALIVHRLGIDTLEVLEAAGGKWNFLPFRRQTFALSLSKGGHGTGRPLLSDAQGTGDRLTEALYSAPTSLISSGC